MLRDRLSIILLIAFLGCDVFLWHRVAAGGIASGIAVLDVGQGDSTLVTLSSGVRILTDAGPDARVVQELERTLPQGTRYIDIAVISHPQLDHVGGFLELVKRYEFGAFIVNGREADSSGPGSSWRALRETIAERDIPLITLGAGDRIRTGGEDVAILSPSAEFVQSAELNDTGIVERVDGNGWRALLTADTGFSVEEELVQTHADIRADILKVGHHGSKYSTSDAFLKAVSPRIATISDGANNTYGHPAPETLERLASEGINVFRTDQLGTITIMPKDGKLTVTTER